MRRAARSGDMGSRLETVQPVAIGWLQSHHLQVARATDAIMVVRQFAEEDDREDGGRDGKIHSRTPVGHA